MSRSVALLRGINVGPSTRLAMPLVTQLFEEAGASDVTTILASGNVVFDGIVDAEAIAARIVEVASVRTRILVVDAERMRRVAAAMPFTGDNESRLVISFMHALPDVELPTGLEPELIAFGEGAVYQWLPDGVLATRLPASFWRQFPPELTARNVRTVGKILARLG